VGLQVVAASVRGEGGQVLAGERSAFAKATADERGDEAMRRYGNGLRRTAREATRVWMGQALAYHEIGMTTDRHKPAPPARLGDARL